MLKKLALAAFAVLVCTAAPASAQVRIGVDGVQIGSSHRGGHGYRHDRGYRGHRDVVVRRGYRDHHHRGRGYNRGRTVIIHR